MKQVKFFSTALIMMLMGLACNVKHKSPSQTYMPDMAYTTTQKAQEAQFGLHQPSMRVPVKGTVPRDFYPYPYAGDFYAHENKAAGMKNPLPQDRATLYRGKALFNTYCATCHAQDDEGDSPVVSAGFPRPPSLNSSTIQGWTDGQLFHIMTVGRGNMSSYQSQLRPEERWAIARYIRALQRSQNPSAADLKESEKW